jgi:hypothetical protein
MDSEKPISVAGFPGKLWRHFQLTFVKSNLKICSDEHYFGVPMNLSSNSNGNASTVA